MNYNVRHKTQSVRYGQSLVSKVCQYNIRYPSQTRIKCTAKLQTLVSSFHNYIELWHYEINRMTVKIRPGPMTTNMMIMITTHPHISVYMLSKDTWVVFLCQQVFLTVIVSLVQTQSLCPFHCVTPVMCCRSDAVQLSARPSDLVHSLALSDRWSLSYGSRAWLRSFLTAVWRSRWR